MFLEVFMSVTCGLTRARELTPGSADLGCSVGQGSHLDMGSGAA